MQVILFVIFISVLTIPVMQTLQDTNVTPLETLLSTPIEAKDVLIGKYLGSLPTYAIVISLMAGTFLGLFIPFGLSVAQVVILVIVFVLIVLIALWAGIVLAAVIKARLARSPRGRDAGQALALLIALPLVGVIYAVMNGGLLSAMQGDETSLASALWAVPSSWGADVVLSFLRAPGGLGPEPIKMAAEILGLLFFLLASIYAGSKLSGRFYDLEPVSFSTSRAPREGNALRVIRWLTGDGPFSTVEVTVLKDYGRRLENVSRVIYILGLVVLMELFILSSLPRGNYVSIALLTVSWMMAFLCVFVVGEVTARGKENLFVYRKAPGGETRLVLARVVQGCLVVQPISAMSAVIVLLPSGVSFWQGASLTFALIWVSTAYVMMSIGLFLLSPAFSERPSEMIGNAVSILAISFFLYVLCVVLYGQTYGIWALALMSTAIGSVMLFLGNKKIRAVE